MDTLAWITLMGFGVLIWQLHTISDRLLGIAGDMSAVRNRADDWHADKKLADMPRGT